MAAKRPGSTVHTFTAKFAGEEFKCVVKGKRTRRGRSGKKFPKLSMACKRK